LSKQNKRILILDIETKPILSYHWGLFNQNISLDQIKEDGGVLCVGAKWLGGKNCHFFSEWEDGTEGMLEKTHALLMEADAVVGYNSTSFDIPRLRGRMVEHRLPPLPNLTEIDLLKTVRKLGLTSGKLAFVGPFLKIGQKVKNSGWSLWIDVLNGNRTAQRKMERYCVGDVKLTEQVYNRLKPYMFNHPNLGNGHNCGKCGSTKVQSRGWRVTGHFRIQRVQCQSCGGWGEGKREKIT
jgi:hypothetical protein